MIPRSQKQCRTAPTAAVVRMSLEIPILTLPYPIP